MTPSQQVRFWAHELASMARIGLEFTEDAYDVERYRRIARIAEELAALVVANEFTPERPYLPEVGYATPKVGAVVAAFDADRRVVLVKRADNGRWALPGGFCEVGSSPVENALRELHEEAGVEAEVTSFVGMYDNRHFGSTSPYHIYGLCFAGRATAGEPRPSNETLDARWFAESGLPDDIVPSHRAMLGHAFRDERGVVL